MIGEMDADRVVGYFKGKSILITGSTGFLGKVLVEKILRLQPGIKKVYLLVRAADVESAKRRIQIEVIGREIFQVLKEKHGRSFDSFVEEKICPLEGDVIYDNLGLDNTKLIELSREIDIIVNGAATTNFYERYDVALDSNALGAKHICEFAKKCANLKMLLHVSTGEDCLVFMHSGVCHNYNSDFLPRTAYVAGEQEGLLLEKPFWMGETLKEGTYLDIESEIRLIEETKRELKKNDSSEKVERRTMKELGLKRARYFGWPNTYVFTKAMGEMILGNLRGDLPVVLVRPSIISSIFKEPLPGWMEGVRTIDSVIIGYAKQALSSFLVDLDLIMDVIPGDMVVNAMMTAMAAHSEEQVQSIYHVTSSLRNPAHYAILEQSGHQYFFDNPPCRGKDGEPVRLRKMRCFKTLASFRGYMALKYKFPLEMLRLVNMALCGAFSKRYHELNGKYRYLVHLVDLYAPYTLFKGCFDDINTERLRMVMKKGNNNGDYNFDFDPKNIDWDDYFYKIHIPGVFKYLCD